MENIKWTNDCQGKKDYDGTLIRVSTRYWPRGGGFSLLDSSTGKFQENNERPEIKPSAHSSILREDDSVLFEESFEAETEEEVKSLVEKWVEYRYSQILYSLEKILEARKKS